MGHLCSLCLLQVKTEGHCSLSDISVWLQPEADSWSVSSVDTTYMEAALLYCSALTDNVVRTGCLKDLIQMSRKISENFIKGFIYQLMDNRVALKEY